MDNNDTHRWLLVAQQTPIRLGEPFVLFDLTRTTMTAESSRFNLMQQFHDNILACTVYGGL
jgi:hypothetical protein